MFIVVISCDKKETFTDVEEKQPDKCCLCLEKQGISDKYIYPYTSEELKQFDDYRIKLEVCQIPEDTLKNMCTIGLVDTYYDFPLLFTEIFSEQTTKIGLIHLENNFNGFKALISREDGPEKLITSYKQVDPSITDTIVDAIENGITQFHINFMEVTMAYDSICEKFSSEQRRTLIEYGLKILDEKREYEHDDFSIKCTLHLLGNVLFEEKYPPFIDYIENNDSKDAIKAFLNGFLFVEASVIEKFARSFLM